MSQVKLKFSIATRLLKVILGLYLLVAVVLTSIQMYTEYLLTRNTVMDEIQQLEQTYGPGLGNALWTFNTEGLNLLLIGMNEISAVAGVKISYENRVSEMGEVEDQSGKFVVVERNNEHIVRKAAPAFTTYIKHEFPIFYRDGESNEIEVGYGVIYTSTRIIFNRVKDGFLLILVSATLNILFLGIIFIYFIRRLLAKPLGELALATETVDMNNLTASQINLDSRENDELHVLQNAFNNMLSKLETSKQLLDSYNTKLEKEVGERTKSLQEEVKVRKEAQRIAEKANELKGMFIANTSHEIRTPMTSVYGMVRLLGLTKLETDQRDQLELIERNCERLLAIINDVLDFSKLQSDRITLCIKPFNIITCVSEVVESLRVLADKKQIKILVDANDVPETMHNDEAKLTQVLVNLIGNAIKFTNEGRIKVSVEQDKQDSGLIRFTVMDTGIGIPESSYSELFDEFTQVDGSATRQHSGTGLGLAIAKKYIETMGGEISVESKLGEGSSFSFTILTEKQ